MSHTTTPISVPARLGPVSITEAHAVTAARAITPIRSSPIASCAGLAAGPATGCGFSPDRWRTSHGGRRCGGRYVLGLGASTNALVEGFHDTAFEHPAAKLRDVVTEVPIWVAALGHHTIRLAAELGDGWVPALVARDHLPGWAAQLRQLREAAAPHARPLTVAAGPLTAVDENAATARGIAAGCIAWYLSAMGEVYARSVSGQGYAAQVQAIIAANPRPSPRRGTVPPGAEAVLDQLAACGTCDQVREQLQPWDRAADVVTILLPPGLPWPNIEATLRAAAPGTLHRQQCSDRYVRPYPALPAPAGTGNYGDAPGCSSRHRREVGADGEGDPAGRRGERVHGDRLGVPAHGRQEYRDRGL